MVLTTNGIYAFAHHRAMKPAVLIHFQSQLKRKGTERRQ